MIIAELFATLGLLPDMDSWEKGEGLMGRLGKAAVAVGAAVGAAFTVSAFKGWVNEVTEAGDNAVKTAQRLGFTVEAVQELDYALGQSDASLGDLKIAMRKLAADGVKDPEKALAQLADKFAAMEDGPEKVKLATEKLGRGGAALIPFLNSGSKGIAELREEAHQLGLVINEETAKGFEEFGDNLDRLEGAWKGVKTQIVSAVLPAMSDLVDKALEWIRTHQDEIANAIAIAVQALSKAFEYAGVAMQGVIAAFNWIAENQEVVKAALAAIAIYLGVIAAEALIAAAPFVALIAAITGAVLLVEDLITAFQGGESKIAAAWNKLSTRVKTDLKTLGRIIALPFTGIIATIEMVARAVYHNIGSIISWVEDKVKWVIDKITWAKDEISKFWGGSAEGQQRVQSLTEQWAQPGSLAQSMMGIPQANQIVMPPSTSSGSTTTVSVTAPITVNPAPGMDETKVGQAAADALQSRINQAKDALGGGVR